MLHDGWRALPLAALAVAPAYAAEYMTVEAAQRAAFPDASSFVPVAADLLRRRTRTPCRRSRTRRARATRGLARHGGGRIPRHLLR